MVQRAFDVLYDSPSVPQIPWLKAIKSLKNELVLRFQKRICSHYSFWSSGLCIRCKCCHFTNLFLFILVFTGTSGKERSEHIHNIDKALVGFIYLACGIHGLIGKSDVNVPPSSSWWGTCCEARLKLQSYPQLVCHKLQHKSWAEIGVSQKWALLLCCKKYGRNVNISF